MTFYLWVRSVELLIDPLSLALNNQIRIFANLLCDVGMRIRAHSRLPHRSHRNSFPASLVRMRAA
jgi:hypothetical protein